MKFEEVLPKMRDEGRIGVWDGYRNKFEGERFIREYPQNDWGGVSFGYRAFTSDEWTLEPIKVKKWRWVFGRDETMLYLTELFFSENEAEYFRIERGFAWKHPIPQTYTEEEEE